MSTLFFFDVAVSFFFFFTFINHTPTKNIVVENSKGLGQKRGKKPVTYVLNLYSLK